MNFYYFFSIFALLSFAESIRYDFFVLQQNVYNENHRYLKWGMNHKLQVFGVIDSIVFFLMLGNLKFQNSLFFWVFFLYLFSFFFRFWKRKHTTVKIPFRVTGRIQRLIFTMVFLLLISLYLVFHFSNIYGYFAFLSFLVWMHFFLVYLCLLVNIPVEKMVFLYYRNQAKTKLQSMSHMKVIGITGSYGKTSSKNILNEILNVKFNSFATPKNYNTQYGLMITINNYLDKYEDIFIAEMGAYKRGRIQLCCDLVHPSIGILTSIGTAHLETFGSQENIQKGKFELIESLLSDGLAVLNLDDPNQANYPLQNNVEVKWISIKDRSASLYAKDILMNKEGMRFTVVFQKTKQEISFSTKLLGIPNVYNILGSLAVAEHLGLSYEEMQMGVSKVSAVPHRLELRRHGDYTIIDDAYNSNPVGAKMALDVLSLMEGYRVVVTPGMIEMGLEQDHLNEEFGKQIGTVADFVILVGEKQTKPIYEGIKKSCFDMKQVRVVNDIQEAFSIFPTFQKTELHTYILLENDLPDIYNE